MRYTILVAAMVAMATPLSAQARAHRTPEQIKASYDAHQGDCDYLLGDWEFTATSQQYGTFRGRWSAVRLADGAAILDEYRVLDDSGGTIYATTTLRAYNATLDQWELVSLGGDNGLQDRGTGHKVGAEMHILQKFGVMSAAPSLWRIRYSNITADHFSWAADRSTDNGRTWTALFQTIEARRIGPPRHLPALAPAKH